MLINFMAEAILYGSELFEQVGELPSEEITLRNINLSIGDLKVVFTIIAIILWCWVWLKIK